MSDGQADALAALGRLVQRKVLSPEEGVRIGRLLTRDPAFQFEPVRPAPVSAAVAAAAVVPAADASSSR